MQKLMILASYENSNKPKRIYLSLYSKNLTSMDCINAVCNYKSISKIAPSSSDMKVAFVCDVSTASLALLRIEMLDGNGIPNCGAESSVVLVAFE